MFWTTPCRSIPASMKLGRGGGKGGSTHLSRKVLGFSETSANIFFESAAEFEGAGTNGLENRDLVGLGVGVDIVAPHATTSLSLRPASPPAGAQRIWGLISLGPNCGDAELNTSLFVKYMQTGQDRGSRWWDALYFW